MVLNTMSNFVVVLLRLASAPSGMVCKPVQQLLYHAGLIPPA